MIAQAGPVHDRNLIVLSAGRSGSSLLVNYLNSNRQIHCHGELLNPEHEIYGTVAGKTRQELILHVASFFQPRAETYVGAKFMTHQFDELDLSLRDILDVLQRPRVLALYRRNLLDTYVSLRIAEQTNVWYSAHAVNHEAVTLDLGDFYAFAAVQRRRWRDCMQEVAGLCAFVCCAYEDLVSDSAAVMNRVFAFLELPSTPVNSESVRQNPGNLQRKIANYAAIPAREMAQAEAASLQSLA